MIGLVADLPVCKPDGYLLCIHARIVYQGRIMPLVEKDTRTTQHTKQQRTQSAKAAVFEACQKHNFDPIEALVLYAKGDYEALDLAPVLGKDDKGQVCHTNPIELKHRYQATKEVAQYYAPKLKSVEVKATDDGGNLPELDLSLLQPDELKTFLALAQKAQDNTLTPSMQAIGLDDD